MRPPSVARGVWVEETKGVEEIGVEEVCDSLSLFVGEASVVVIRFRAGKIDFFVSGIKIATNDDRFFSIEQA